MPNKPGVRPPPVETILMLLFCERCDPRRTPAPQPLAPGGPPERPHRALARPPPPHPRAWQRFGRNLLLLEFIFHLLLVGVLSFVSMDRISPRPMLTRNLCAAASALCACPSRLCRFVCG